MANACAGRVDFSAFPPATLPGRLPVSAAALGDVADEATVLPASTAAREVDRLLRSDIRLRGVVVRDGDRLHLLTRQHADNVLAGAFGFGRALHHRSRVRDMLPERSLVLPAETPLVAAARAMLARAEDVQHDDVVVSRGDGTVGLVPASTVFRHVSDLYQQISAHDPLTGLPNRLMIEHCAAALFRDADESTGRRPALLYVDLDHFKNVNDTLGHRAGDEVLVGVAGRLLAAVRPEDLVARLGGDEFAVLLSAVTPVEAEAVAERVIMSCAAPFVVADAPVYIGASVGVAIAGDQGGERNVGLLEVLLRRADAAMYQAKAGGRGRLHRLRAQSEVDTATRRAAIVRRLHQALTAGALAVHYQPKVRLSDRRVIEVEALIRWTDAELGPVSPAEFIPVAESTGQIMQIGLWVLAEAARQTQRWRAAGSDITVAVNLSAVQLNSPDLIADVQRALHAAGLPASRLQLEITESAAVKDVRRTVDTLDQLRALGIRISLDDFGTGYSSLAMLRELPLNDVKIDRTFVQALEGNSKGTALVRLVVEAAHAMGLSVIAEGVETESQLDAIEALGCDAAQGYLLGRPVPAEELVLHD